MDYLDNNRPQGATGPRPRIQNDNRYATGPVPRPNRRGPAAHSHNRSGQTGPLPRRSAFSDQTGPLPRHTSTGQTGPFNPQTGPFNPQNPAPGNLGGETASPREKDSDYYLSRLEEKLKTARKLPLSEQCVVDRMELLLLLDNARKSLPDDLRRAQWLLEQNHNLIAETRKEAEKIMRDAEQEIAKMVDEHEITQAAQEEAQRIMEEAGMQSRQIHDEAMAYVNNLLQDLESQLTEMLVYVRKNKSQF